MAKYNKTQLDIEKASERGILHRDYIAHCLRWSHVMKHAKMGQKLLDVGCGLNTPMAMTFYANKFRPSKYVGLDIRHKFKYTDQDFPFPFYTQGNFDVTIPDHWVDVLVEHGDVWHTVVCFEVIEHMNKVDGIKLLTNMADYCGESDIYLSTPCFNGSAAANHIHEWEYQELKDELEKLFVIKAHYGTFASQRDIKPVFSPEAAKVFSELHAYYDSNFLSVVFAPMYPAQSRNCIWKLKAK